MSESETMTPEEFQREMGPLYGTKLPDGRFVAVSKLTDRARGDMGRDPDEMFVLYFSRPARPEDEEEWAKYQRKLIANRDKAEGWVTECYVSPEAADALLSCLMKHLMPDFCAWAEEEAKKQGIHPSQTGA